MMRNLHIASILVFGTFASLPSWAAETCRNPYTKVLPYHLPLGNDQATVGLESELRFEYDCKSFLAQAQSSAYASVFDLDIDLVAAQALAFQNRKSTSEAFARLMVLGFEVAREDLDLTDLVDSVLSPGTDIDISGEMDLNVGPIPVPVKYGIEGQAALELKAALQNLALTLEAVPVTESRVYVQAGADILVAKAEARGDITLLDDRLTNRIALTFEDEDKLYLRLNAESHNHMKALSGQVMVYASAGVGALKKDYSRELLNWTGFERTDLLFEFSDRLGISNP
jgi:hypothetical protein